MSIKEYKRFHKNSGQLKVHEFYKNGKQEGERKLWHDNGQLAVKFYKNGQLDGECKQWAHNGQLVINEFYKNGN